MRLALIVATAIILAAGGAVAQQRQAPQHKPAGPPALQPPSPSAGKLSNPDQSQPSSGQQPTSREERGTENVPLTVKVLPSTNTQAEIEEEQHRANEHAANERGLTTATWGLAGFTLLLALIAGGQIVLFFWQLRLIRESLQDAKIAADAARDGALAATVGATASRDSADIARFTMIARDRAYIHHNTYRWISHLSLATNKYFWRIRPSWVNSGNTPPRDLFIYVCYELRDTPLPDEFRFEVPAGTERRPATIAPEGIIGSWHYDIIGDDLVAINNGVKFFYVWGIARYRDVFPETPLRITRFCHFIQTITGDPLKPWHAEINPMDIFFAGYHQNNCTDEDCENT